MSRQNNSDDSSRPLRPRANTSTFGFSHWSRRGRIDTPSSATAETPVLSLDALIEALSPPSVPSLSHAKSLASLLAFQSPKPRPSVLLPIISVLCAADTPSALRAAGFDAMANYWSGEHAMGPTIADRSAYLALILDFSGSDSWSKEVWYPRLKALGAVTQLGDHAEGSEVAIIQTLTHWIKVAFQQFVIAVTEEERSERKRSIELTMEFMMDRLTTPQFVSRLPPSQIVEIVRLYGGLLDSAVATQHRNSGDNPEFSTSVFSPDFAVDFAVERYLDYLSRRFTAIAPDHLQTVLPFLFRALACYASPLPRLSIERAPQLQPHPELATLSQLDKLFSGPYAASCTILLKCYLSPSGGLLESAQTSLGALRTLRVSLRGILRGRLARCYISNAASDAYSVSGIPANMEIENDLYEQAWSQEDVAAWTIPRFRVGLCNATRAWIGLPDIIEGEATRPLKDLILQEVAGILKDATQAFHEMSDGDIDHEETEAVREIMTELVAFIRTSKTVDGSTIVLDLSQNEYQADFLGALSTLLSQDYDHPPLYEILPTVTLSIAEHITDFDTANLLQLMSDRLSLSPISPDWLRYWRAVLEIPDLYTSKRASTRLKAMDSLKQVWQFVKDLPIYRRPLASLVYSILQDYLSNNDNGDTDMTVWNIIADDLVLRIDSGQAGSSAPAEQTSDPSEEDIIDSLYKMSLDSHNSGLLGEPSSIPIPPSDASSPISPGQSPSLTANISPVSPILSRTQTTLDTSSKESEGGMPSVMSLLSSIASGTSSRSQSQPTRQPNPTTSDSGGFGIAIPTSTSKPAGAVAALISSFCQLAFTELSVSEQHVILAVKIFRILVEILSFSHSAKAKLTALQFLMRLRVDRDHRLYFAIDDYDKDGNIYTLASQIFRTSRSGMSAVDLSEEADMGPRTRSRFPQERSGRRPSRGPGSSVPMYPPRSRSRAPVPRILQRATTTTVTVTPYTPLWTLPETLTFARAEFANIPSDGLCSYDPNAPKHVQVLPTSLYLASLLHILSTDSDWDMVSYVLCHLPTQLANKHLFCGPNSKKAVSDLLITLSSRILDGKLASNIRRWPEGLIQRDAHGLGYHTLTVLVSYRQCFKDIQLHHRLVDVFLFGLSDGPHAIKTCLHALSLCAFELQPSMTKFLPRILEKLSQIISNPIMAVDIIDFLAIVGSLPELQVNFTESDFKTVFGVALQYLLYHNRTDGPTSISWALSQHVRIMSYYIVYLWFLAVQLPDRPRHIKYITRQLLLANEGKSEVDEPAEVCFDWLARYTYGSADPRPANSTLSDLVMNSEPDGSAAMSQKSWLMGNSVLTIRTLDKRGWVEVLSRRASGLTKFICRAENIPMVTAGDVDPDILSLAAGLAIGRSSVPEEIDMAGEDETPELPRPDPITGYVWSGSAPSQRRKEVSIDPSYFALQLSTYPDARQAAERVSIDPPKLASFVRNLDRMPVIDTHKVGVMYVAPGQTLEADILRNSHGSPAYTRFLEGLGRLINLRGQKDVYAGGLDPDEDGEYAYAWWDDIGQVLYHTATLMPSDGEECINNKKRHIGNDFVRIIWNDSGEPYKFETLSTQFQFVNIVIEPHSRGAIAAFSNNVHENEYFKVTLQRAPGMTEFTPIGDFKIISAERLPLLIRQLSLLTDWFVSVFQHTEQDTRQVEMTTNWRSRLQAIKRFRSQVATTKDPTVAAVQEGIMSQEAFRDFTTYY